MIISNGTLITWDDPNQVLEGQALYVNDGRIEAIGPQAAIESQYQGEEHLDAGGQYVMPGNICAHTHFYGAFARGIAIPGAAPKDFPEILQKLWWPLDRSQTLQDVRSSAQVMLADAIRHGTTTLIDHHASPNAIDGSLDVIAEEVDRSGHLCPNCGAKISFDIHETTLVCQFCGFTHKVDDSITRDSTDGVLDVVLPTTPAHRWAENQTRATCEQCGVSIILPSGQTADSCPYCASNRFVSYTSLRELIDPQVIGLFKVDPDKAARSIKTWLSKALLSPDNLASQHSGMFLHPAYYPFWLFGGTLEIPWFCDVNVGSGKAAVWEAHTGSQFEMFDNVLIPGLHKIAKLDLAGIEPVYWELL